jgi:hypothetical protein
LTNKVYKGYISYVVEQKKNFWFLTFSKTREFSFEYPHLVIAVDEQSARNTINFSEMWKKNIVPDENCGDLDILEKNLYVEEIENESILFYMNNMSVNDFLVYIKGLQESVL